MIKMIAPFKRQRGVAVVTALLLTTLAVTLVFDLFWQQQVHVRAVENQQALAQKEWALRGTLDWARITLSDDAKRSNNVVYLGQPWSMPLTNGRTTDRPEGGQDAAPDVLFSRQLIDAQSRYNLSNLTANGKVNAAELASFKRLLLSLQLPLDVANSIVQAQLQSQKSLPLTLPLSQPDDLLALRGITPTMLEKLRNFIVILPQPTPVNLNTAPLEVLAACFDGLSRADAKSLIDSRSTAYFRDASDFSARMAGNKAVSSLESAADVAFASRFFLADNYIRVGRANSHSLSLIELSAERSSVLWTKEL